MALVCGISGTYLQRSMDEPFLESASSWARTVTGGLSRSHVTRNYSAPPNNSTQNITKRVAYGEKSCYGSEKRFSAAATNISSGRYECFQRPLRMFPAAATNREGSAFIPRRFGLHPAKVRPSSLSHGAYPFAMTLCGLAACLGSFQMTEQILSVSRQWVLNGYKLGKGR